MPEARFIAFKTPLSNDFFDGKNGLPFMIPDVVKEVYSSNVFLYINLKFQVEKTGKKLGLVMDLTATTRYYESSEWSNHGVLYKKIFCNGHHIHLQPDLIGSFVKHVDDFFENQKDEGFKLNLIMIICNYRLYCWCSLYSWS